MTGFQSMSLVLSEALQSGSNFRGMVTIIIINADIFLLAFEVKSPVHSFKL